MSSPITTHVLDTSLGRPAAGIKVDLEAWEPANSSWVEVGSGTTDSDGRIGDLLQPGLLRMGTYRISFGVDAYFRAQSVDSFYPVVRIEFSIGDEDQHYHVPLLLNPFGYSTYRGS